MLKGLKIAIGGVAAFLILALVVVSQFLDTNASLNYVKMTNVVHVKCRFLNAGVPSNDERQHGISALISNLLFRRLEDLSPEETVKKIEEYGVFSLSVDASEDDFQISFCVLKDHAAKALKFLSEAFVNPKFTVNDLEYVKCYIPSTLNTDTSSPELLLTEKLMELLYGNHNYGKNNTGTDYAISKVTISDIKDYMKQYFVKRNAEISFTGDLSKTEMLLYAWYLLKNLPTGEPSQTKNAIPNSSNQQNAVIDKANMAEAVGIIYGGRIDNPSNKEIAAVQILMHCLFERDFIRRCRAQQIASKTKIIHFNRKYSSSFAVLSFVGKDDFSNYRACITHAINDYAAAIPKDMFETSKLFFIKKSQIGIVNLGCVDSQLNENQYPFEEVSYEFAKATLAKMLPGFKWVVIGSAIDPVVSE